MLDQHVDLDRVFRALADPGRRRMVEQLSQRPASVSELSRPLDMTLAAVLQHVQVLEASGLVRTQKAGRTRTCSINPAVMRSAESWIAERRTLTERRLDRLGEYLAGADDIADQRDVIADQREQAADEREERLTGLASMAREHTQRCEELLARSYEALARSDSKIARASAALGRIGKRDFREQAAVDRELQPSRAYPPRADPGPDPAPGTLTRAEERIARTRELISMARSVLASAKPPIPRLDARSGPRDAKKQP